MPSTVPRAAAALFATVPTHDYADFGVGAAFQPKRVYDWLALKKEDAAHIASVSTQSIRWDDHMPTDVRDRFEEIGSIINMAAAALGGDIHKTSLWFRTPNPLLGDISPRDMVRLGRYMRLRKYILSASSESARVAA
jgi:hypothetical protein